MPLTQPFGIGILQNLVFSKNSGYNSTHYSVCPKLTNFWLTLYCNVTVKVSAE